MGAIVVALTVMGISLLTTSGASSLGSYIRQKNEEMKKKLEELEKEEKEQKE